MPFGLVNSEPPFVDWWRSFFPISRILTVSLIICGFSLKREDHMTSLRQVLDRLRSARMTAIPSKCVIGYSSIECIGNNIVDQTVRPQEDKIQAIRDAPHPTSKRQMKSFLGLAGFYSRFIPNFSSIASPFMDLTKRDRPNSIRVWQDQHEKAFQALKNRLTSNPFLRLPVNYNINVFKDGKPFVLRTDASDVGIGAVLFHGIRGWKTTSYSLC